MDQQAKKVAEQENLRNIIAQWNANRLDLFEISEPNEVSHAAFLLPFFLSHTHTTIHWQMQIACASSGKERESKVPRNGETAHSVTEPTRFGPLPGRQLAGSAVLL